MKKRIKRLKKRRITFRVSKRKKSKSFKIFLKSNSKITILIILSLMLFFEGKFKNISSIKVGLCVMCKEENLYIKEFIEHYKNLGYNHIFIYDNNNVDGEKIEDVFKKEIDEEFISIINYRGIGKRPQIKAYANCYKKNNKNYNWLSFFDTDEFLEIKPKGIKIQRFLSNERYKYCQNIKFNWLIYSDNDKLYYENKPVQKRFKTALYEHISNKHIKSTVRGNLTTNYWKVAINPHTALTNYNCCSSSGKQISASSPYNIPYDYKYGKLKHYSTKSIEEYIKKIRKGNPNNDSRVIKKMIHKFYLINKKTKEKSDIFKKEFKIF